MSDGDILPSIKEIMMIALYYCYKNILKDDLEDNKDMHVSICERLHLNGRIRVSPEGINGVLSGTLENLRQYEAELHDRLFPTLEGENRFVSDSVEKESFKSKIKRYGETFDVKYCHLRSDVPPEKQLFDSLQVTITQDVVSLLPENSTLTSKTKKRGGRRKEKSTKTESVADIAQFVHQYEPSPHLKPEEWNHHLLLYSSSSASSTSHVPSQLDFPVPNDAILVDARNIYESKIGHFSVRGVPTLLTNTRKYSDLTSVLETSMKHFAGKRVFMYCTGGVRCERASAYLQALADSDKWPQDLEKPKNIYQLQGGIQKYLEMYGVSNDTSSTPLSSTMTSNISSTCYGIHKNDLSDHQKNPSGPCLFRGKNFVFDPRRYDPVVGPEPSLLGKCLLCKAQHDDYDNGFAACDNKEARCVKCRVLVLVCDVCRSQVRVWGEEETKVEKPRPLLYCGSDGEKCAAEGVKMEDIVEIVWSS